MTAGWRRFGIAMVLLVFMTSRVVYAQENTLTYENTEAEVHCVPDTFEMMSNDELFEGYVDQQFYGDCGIATYSVDRMGDRLPAKEKKVYQYLKKEITQIANGERENAKLEFPVSLLLDKLSYTAEELGVDAIVKNNAISQEAVDAMNEKVSYNATEVMNALFMDCPYELYWFEKSRGYSYAVGVRLSAKQVNGVWTISCTTENLYIALCVDAQFSKSGSVDTYDADITKTSAAMASAANAGKIVAAAKDKSDYEKLVYYADRICDLVAYNHDAADAGSKGLGTSAPWQLIYVFDEDPNTNVVCEGYSKAYQYLCEMTQFHHADIYCMQITGEMNGGGHMWNAVHMWDGKNYLVDVTNYENYYKYGKRYLLLDGGKASENGFEMNIPRFQIGASSYIKAQTITYQYDQDMYDAYTLEELELSDSAYTAPDKEVAPNAPSRIEGCIGQVLSAQMLSDYPGWEWVSTEYTVPDEAGATMKANVVYNGSDRAEYLTGEQEVIVYAVEHDFGTGKLAACKKCGVKNKNGEDTDNPARPEEPKSEEPKPEEPKSEEQKPEKPRQEEPTSEEPKSEEPRQEEPTLEEIKSEQPKQISNGTVVTIAGDKGTYIIKDAKKKQVQYLRVGKGRTITIPDRIVVDGERYTVTGIAAQAFSGNRTIRKVVIGKNIKTIGKNAFRNCKKLKMVIIRSTSLTNKRVGAKAFQGIASNAKVKVPKSKYSAYRKLLKKKGITGRKQKIAK